MVHPRRLDIVPCAIQYCCRNRGAHTRAQEWALSNNQKWIVQGDTCADKATDLLGRGAQAESRRVREPRRTALPVAFDLGFYEDGISFWVISSQSPWFRIFSGGTCIVQQKCLPMRRTLGGARHVASSSDYSQILLLVSSVFLTRTSCPQITHTDGSYVAWPEWAISGSLFPLIVKGNSKGKLVFYSFYM